MKRRTAAMLLAVMLAVLFALPVCANAEAGPDFTVLIDNAPADLAITLIAPEGTEIPLHPVRRGWESCFRLYYHDIYEAVGGSLMLRSDEMEEIAENSVLRVVSVSDGLDFTLSMPEADQMYYNHLAVLHLDRDGNTAHPGVSSYMAWRNTLLVLLRVTVTLITEGVIFRLMSYRSKKSWVVFLVTNLVTQTLLHLGLTGNYLAMGYWEIGFVLAEVLIFLAEAAVFGCLLTEQHRLRGVVTALLANAVSLACGWFLLAYLPL